MKKYINKTFMSLVALVVALGVYSCKDPEIGVNPYDGGEAPLGVKFQNLNRKLDAVRPGEVFQVSINGLKSQTGALKAYINEQETEMVSYTDSTLDLRVPQLVSSGRLKVLIGNQVFYGPRIPIEGKVKVDTDLAIANGFNGTVNTIFENGANYWIGGYFTNYEDEASSTIFRNNIHSITSLGKSVEGGFKKGGMGGISSIAKLPDGKFMIAGGLSSFNGRLVSAITRLESTGTLDTMMVEVINPDPDKPENNLDTVPAFNGYLTSSVVSGGGVNFSSITGIYPLPNSSMIVIGNFTNHLRTDYMFSSKQQKSYFNTRVRNVVRLKNDGAIDSTFMWGNTGVNGTIGGSIQLADGKILAVGNFTTFNSESANRIFAINPDGTRDKSFTGAGANDLILSITYNRVLKKIALAGRFTSYNGKAANGVVILNEDGSVDEQFVMKDTDSRIPTYAYVMNNGKILVTGGFEKYDGVTRSNLLILEMDGSAKQEYNNMGSFSGSIYTVVEATSSEGYPALLIGGTIFSVDGINVGNIVRIEIKN
ncbi:DUF5008 domain-containing protein [Sphingobacterium pedocola]|uniref:DUF5008 domain-containing protein n=1 Tax=Sphingobacterium pedocola TaxID=2082722 RepID=A0ABR9TC66_9SPHI|nr:DUF5008 domain-containing protein [Sphingobacterium pedocola]MBE8722955.1 hypothetical protein [Sphingobacterium pedocola]